jgi:Glycosyl transferase family 2
MTEAADSPLISVVIPTFDRAALLAGCLAGLSSQTLRHNEFEVVVVDDGSRDGTAEVSAARAGQLPLRYYRTAHAGSPAAKNLGLFLATAPIVLFLDDDDIPAPDLLAEHLAGHRDHSQSAVAILGHTGWAAGLRVSLLMRYVTDINGLLYDYRHLSDGMPLDYRYFWSGRTSCKRSFLIQRGLFRPSFDSGLEDVELGRRLAPAGLQLIYRSTARQYTARPITLDGFLARCAGQGRGRRMLAALYPDDPKVQEYCAVPGAPDRWTALSHLYEHRVAAARQLEARLEPEHGAVRSRVSVDELYRLYGWCFLAAMVRGAAQSDNTPAVPLGDSKAPGNGNAVRPRPAAAPARR